ncbi:hypothetical protein ABB55_13930 [Prosthecomicrobium hirschii]|uniref:Uncharacterized protein n=1 Tax=Prosthecodimorpha hirschii TaxID=665126 RepID=A0A0P6W1Z5_9HYPH|nr:hypothetical protein [Prosthecomicrobium hirschii]KPL53175.1 hypothetical protein ABB55_13930 [Prosthecomicrobium hirschii]
MATIRKPYYRLDELCTRWGLSIDDLADFALSGEITVSALVVGLNTMFGDYDEVGNGEYVRIPMGYRRLTGPADLTLHDAWHAIHDGAQTISGFDAPDSSFVAIDDPRFEDGFPVGRDQVVVRREEVDRFERVQGLVQDQEAPVSGANIQRGAQPRYDWDAFWIELCRSVYADGLPASQAELVRQMRDWFEMTGSAPDDSTIKKKLAPLWRTLRASDLRQSA